MLPQRIILVRHAQSEGNIDNIAYTYIPDPQIPLTKVGLEQASEVRRWRCTWWLKRMRIHLICSAKIHNIDIHSTPVQTTRLIMLD